MKQVQILALAGAMYSALAFGIAGSASASSLMPLASSVLVTQSTTPSATHPHVLKVQKTGDKSYRKRQNNQRLQQYKPNNNKKHHNKKKHYNKKKKRYYNPGVWVGGDRYYDPYYDDPYYNDPFYDPYYATPNYNTAPSYGRLSCRQIIGMLRQKGYRRIEARDCTGKVYTFFAYAGHKRYKLRVRSRNGSFKTRKRI